MNFRAMKRNHWVGVALALSVVGLGIGQALLQNKADAQANTVQAPMFEVDPFWPKTLPNNWILGQIGGLTVAPMSKLTSLVRDNGVAIAVIADAKERLRLAAHIAHAVINRHAVPIWHQLSYIFDVDV